MSLPIATLTGANTIAQLIYNVNQIKTLAANTTLTGAYVANTVFQSALANTNAYIATKTDITDFNLALANTNAYINNKLDSATHYAALANTNAYISTKTNTTDFNSALANTNLAISDKLQVANTNLATTNNAIALFDGITGKLLKEAPVEIDPTTGVVSVGGTTPGFEATPAGPLTIERPIVNGTDQYEVTPLGTVNTTVNLNHTSGGIITFTLDGDADVTFPAPSSNSQYWKNFTVTPDTFTPSFLASDATPAVWPNDDEPTWASAGTVYLVARVIDGSTVRMFVGG
jgi:hypothetical protein